MLISGITNEIFRLNFIFLTSLFRKFFPYINSPFRIFSSMKTFYYSTDKKKTIQIYLETKGPSLERVRVVKSPCHQFCFP